MTDHLFSFFLWLERNSYNWERPKPGRENVHPFAEEKKLYKTLEKRGMITLY